MAEQPFGILHVKADPVVAKEKWRVLFFTLLPDLDHGVFAPP
jgi:hypothetical protein